ncbi:MAG: hypothetical protein HKN23_21160 [Verrucomicrobiales bacterium]|nr:hypothetical protein [Verrucomicrobiales bacterium]
MKNQPTLPTFFAIAALFTTGVALSGDSKAPIDYAPPVVEDVYSCFTPGFEFSGFVAGLVPDGAGDDNLGGGAALSYFYTESFGFELSYSVFDTDPSEEHLATLNAVYRFVGDGACIAPYVKAGGGVLTNGSTAGVYNAGAGLDIRFQDWDNVGIFADATYNWVEDDSHEDFTFIRAGFRIKF